MKSPDYVRLEIDPNSKEDREKLFNEAIEPNIFASYFNEVRDILEANYDYFMSDGSEIIIYPKYVEGTTVAATEFFPCFLKDEEGTHSIIMDAVFFSEEEFFSKYGKRSIIYFANRKGNLSMGEIYPPDENIFTAFHLAKVIMKEEDDNDTNES